MDLILRRSSLFYATSLMTYTGLLGRFMLTRDWPVFEVIPLFVPIWLVSGMLASEHDERYAFLRMLPVPDRVVVRTKFTLILSTTAAAWTFMIATGIFRMDDGIASTTTLVYVTLVCASTLLLTACYQIGIWRFGLPVMIPVVVVSIVAGLVLCIAHVANLKSNEYWPAFSRLGFVEWLGGMPWISIVIIVALALVAFNRLMRLGVRIKASSEACL